MINRHRTIESAIGAPGHVGECRRSVQARVSHTASPHNRIDLGQAAGPVQGTLALSAFTGDDRAAKNPPSNQRTTRGAVLLAIDASRSRIARVRLARRLAPAVLHQLRIPADARNVPIWIGQFDAGSNQEAVENWIAQQLLDTNLTADSAYRDPLSALVNRLHRILVDAELLE